ncbi:energy-coupling factor transport system ATP-binding protein [Nocardioides exalbidus]|uniref:Energy-coupling factor transport system ATP-binding protein n=1 Tax=Nocardioides exalbidus TaxID=402596 RepID=A0A1H4I3E3_9ACTN|nr:ATP-binding cassette domain-containing protein [Nocardioides exalbidus]SEB28617.1 energy-coupling factor transport system ATP-binding protein [Nocardioides exalbidus]
MIDLRGIGFRYDEREVLRGVDLSLDEGELVLVSGRTGVGKSTLLGVVTGLVPRFTGGVLTGDVLLDGASIVDQPPRERAHVVGYVGQDPLAGFVTDTVEEELAYGMEQVGTAPGTMRRRVEETLDLLGIADLRSRDLRTLSGGQQQRVAIGSVLTMHPRVLVLDEPTSALDPTAAEDVLATITRLVHDLGLTVLLAEHRLERVVPFADRICLVTGDGGIRVDSPHEVLADSPVAPPLVELGRLVGWSPLPLTVRDARRQARGLPDLAPPTPPEPPRAAPLLVARGVSVVHGSHVAVRDLDLTLGAGRVTVLMGRNGSGKSSLIWALQGTGKRRSGTVHVAGDDPADLALAQRRTHVGLVPQTAADLLYLESVTDECAAADTGAGAAAGTCRGLLDRLAPGIDPTIHPRDLSEGQRLALALSIVLTARPPVVLLDEPTRGLDYAGKAELARIVADLAADARAVLLATHDVEFAAHVADEVVVMAEGEVVSSGSPQRVLAESPSFAPQVTKVLGAPWLVVEEVATALDGPDAEEDAR